MTKYVVFSNEIVYYSTVVEADSHEEAMNLVKEGLDPGLPDDGSDFQVTDAELYDDVYESEE